MKEFETEDWWRVKATPEERAACTHPNDARDPLSGDDWVCGLCGEYVEAPTFDETGLVAS